jgi:glycosyltransferase involved in cell wall biosynthesis
MAVAGLAAHRAGLPVVWHVRVTGYDPVDRWLMRAADRIVTPSRAVGARFPADEVTVIPNPVVPVDPDRRETDRARLRAELAPEDERLLLVVGLITPRKCQLEAVEAVAAAAPDGPWRLLLAGEEDPLSTGYLRKVRERAAALGIGERVVHLGHRDDVPALMAAGDLLLHLPAAEGFGRVFVEAMAVGLPLLVTPVGGLAELHQSTGYGRMTAGTSPADLTDGVRAALADRDARTDCLARGPALVTERFSPAGHAAAVVEVYRGLLEGGPG